MSFASSCVGIFSVSPSAWAVAVPITSRATKRRAWERSLATIGSFIAHLERPGEYGRLPMFLGGSSKTGSHVFLTRRKPSQPTAAANDCFRQVLIASAKITSTCSFATWAGACIERTRRNKRRELRVLLAPLINCEVALPRFSFHVPVLRRVPEQRDDLTVGPDAPTAAPIEEERQEVKLGDDLSRLGLTRWRLFDDSRNSCFDFSRQLGSKTHF